MTLADAAYLGALLRQYRGTMTLEELSRLSGIGAKTLGSFERDPKRAAGIKLSQGISILRALGKSLADLERDLRAT